MSSTVHQLTPMDAWVDLIGRTFVLGRPNAKGENVIIFGDTRWTVTTPENVLPGERVKVIQQQEDRLLVQRC